MKKKLYALISGLVGVAATTAELLLIYFAPAYYVPIVAAVGIGAKAIDEILLLFVKEE